MTGILTRTLWRVGGASVQGATHKRRDLPNQDAFATSPESGSGPRIAAAVSDGHGARPHFRSQDGSRFAVRGAVEVLSWHLDDAEDDVEAAEHLGGDMIEYWRRAVHADLEARPLDSDKAELYGHSPLIPYGATLIAAAADSDTLHFMQIGDGDILIGMPDGQIVNPLAGDEGLVGEETHSLCEEQAEQYLRQTSVWRDPNTPWPDFVLIASDGVSKSFTDEASFHTAAAQLREAALENLATTLAELPDWLASLSESGSGDDATMCLIVREDAEEEGA